MRTYYNNCVCTANLQALYGSSDSSGEGSDHSTSTVRAPSNPDGDQEFCNDGSIDTIFNSHEGVTYVFKGNTWTDFPMHGIHAYHRVRQSLRRLIRDGTCRSLLLEVNGGRNRVRLSEINIEKLAGIAERFGRRFYV